MVSRESTIFTDKLFVVVVGMPFSHCFLHPNQKKNANVSFQIINLHSLGVSLIRKEIKESLLIDYSVIYSLRLSQNLVLLKILVKNNTGFLEMNVVKYALICQVRPCLLSKYDHILKLSIEMQ
jgi:hypothetical protein